MNTLPLRNDTLPTPGQLSLHGLTAGGPSRLLAASLICLTMVVAGAIASTSAGSSASTAPDSGNIRADALPMAVQPGHDHPLRGQPKTLPRRSHQSLAIPYFSFPPRS